MQQTSSETYKKLSRSPENVMQQSSTNNADFIRVPSRPKFNVTPQSMGLNLLSDTTTSNGEQQPQHEPPLVEEKSYEGHDISSERIQQDSRYELNASFHRSQSNTPTNSRALSKTKNLQLSYFPNSRTEIMTHCLSASSSPKIPSQQWNFETSMNNESMQKNLKYPSVNNDFIQTVSDQLLASRNAAPHTHCSHVQNITSLPEIPIFSAEQQPHKYRLGSDVCGDDSARLCFKNLNDLYAKRIEDIDENAWSDKDLKIFTYQEWVEMLTKINESFIKNMEELEREVTDHLELVQARVNSNCRQSQGNDLMKCRQDINTLIKYIRNIPNYKKSDVHGLTFETISPNPLLDMSDFESLTIDDNGGDELKNYNDADVAQRNKLYANMKALAHEVAEKHDEVRELKRQVICLEDEIQKAQKKIQLKDDVIKELRNDLKSSNNKISSNPCLDPSLAMPPINFENQTCRSENTEITDNNPTSQIDNGSQFDSLSHTEQEEQHKMKILNEEINEFFEMNDSLNKQKMQYHRKRIGEIMEKLESEKAAAYRKLDFIRRQLIDIESDSTEGNNDCDSGFHSKSENDQDAKILDAVRKRLRKLNEMNCELKKRIQKLDLERNELSNNLQTDKSFSELNGNILKQIADLLCDMKGKQFSYTEIYNAGPNQLNPFCEAIIEMHRDFQEKESRLLKALEMKNKENEELSQLLLQNEKNFKEERIMRLNLKNCDDIDNTSATVLLTSLQTQPVTTLQAPPSLSTSLTGQQLDNKAAPSLHRLLDK